MSYKQVIANLKSEIVRLSERNTNLRRDRAQMATRMGKYRTALHGIVNMPTIGTYAYARALAIEALRRQDYEPPQAPPPSIEDIHKLRLVISGDMDAADFIRQQRGLD